MIWRYEESQRALVATHCPSLPEMKGFRQPLQHGIISQVLVTGLPILETQVQDHAQHDPTFDQASGKTCRSLLVVPIPDEAQPGVLAAALFDNGGGSEFGKREMNELSKAAKTLVAKES